MLSEPGYANAPMTSSIWHRDLALRSASFIPAHSANGARGSFAPARAEAATIRMAAYVRSTSLLKAPVSLKNGMVYGRQGRRPFHSQPLQDVRGRLDYGRIVRL